MKTGAAVLVLWERTVGLILRDDNPKIAWPNTWAPPGGGQEDGESLVETAKRELMEEIGIAPEVFAIGLTSNGSGVFYAKISDEEARSSSLRGEGQRFMFFSWARLDQMELGGVFRYMFEQYPDQVKEMVRSGEIPQPEALGLLPMERGAKQ